jgi:hypothetical protein
MPDLETPDEDAVEQQQTVSDPEAAVPESSPSLTDAAVEADEGDLVESSLEVPLDEDDWR